MAPDSRRKECILLCALWVVNERRKILLLRRNQFGWKACSMISSFLLEDGHEFSIKEVWNSEDEYSWWSISTQVSQFCQSVNPISHSVTLVKGNFRIQNSVECLHSEIHNLHSLGSCFPVINFWCSNVVLISDIQFSSLHCPICSISGVHFVSLKFLINVCHKFILKYPIWFVHSFWCLFFQ